MIKLPSHIQKIINNSELKNYEPILAKDAPAGSCVYLDWFGSAYVPEGIVYVGKHSVERQRVSKRFMEKANGVVGSLKPSSSKKKGLSVPFQRENVDTLKPIVMQAIPTYKDLSKTVVRDRVVSLMQRNTVVFMLPKDAVSDFEQALLNQVVTLQTSGVIHCDIRNKRMEFNGKDLLYSDMKSDVQDGLNWFGLTPAEVDKMASVSNEAIYLNALSPEEKEKHVEQRKAEDTQSFFKRLRKNQSRKIKPYERGSIDWLLGGIEVAKQLDEPLDHLDKLCMESALLTDDPVAYLNNRHVKSYYNPKALKKMSPLCYERLLEHITKGRMSWVSLLGDCKFKDDLLLKKAF